MSATGDPDPEAVTEEDLPDNWIEKKSDAVKEVLGELTSVYNEEGDRLELRYAEQSHADVDGEYVAVNPYFWQEVDPEVEGPNILRVLDELLSHETAHYNWSDLESKKDFAECYPGWGELPGHVANILEDEYVDARKMREWYGLRSKRAYRVQLVSQTESMAPDVSDVYARLGKTQAMVTALYETAVFGAVRGIEDAPTEVAEFCTQVEPVINRVRAQDDPDERFKLFHVVMQVLMRYVDDPEDFDEEAFEDGPGKTVSGEPEDSPDAEEPEMDVPDSFEELIEEAMEEIDEMEVVEAEIREEPGGSDGEGGDAGGEESEREAGGEDEGEESGGDGGSESASVSSLSDRTPADASEELDRRAAAMALVFDEDGDDESEGAETGAGEEAHPDDGEEDGSGGRSGGEEPGHETESGGSDRGDGAGGAESGAGGEEDGRESGFEDGSDGVESDGDEVDDTGGDSEGLGEVTDPGEPENEGTPGEIDGGEVEHRIEELTSRDFETEIEERYEVRLDEVDRIDDRDRSRWASLVRELVEYDLDLEVRKRERDDRIETRRDKWGEDSSKISESLRRRAEDAGIVRELEEGFREIVSRETPKPARRGTRIDTINVARRAAGDATVTELFEDEVMNEVGDRCVGLATDISGSMGSSIDELKIAGAAIGKATDIIGDEFVWEAFTDQSGHKEERLDLRIVTGPNEDFEWEHVDSFYAANNEPTAAGVRDCFNLMQQTDANEYFMIVITDGCALVCENGVYEAHTNRPVEQARQAVNEVRAQGVDVVGLGIGGMDDQKMEETFGGRNYRLTSIDHLANDILDLYKEQLDTAKIR